ncbi:hypothetical protein VTJ83DRAFT_4415 [Remersonia thermophila]|uniref:TauD/TfdA-like domain-containing protein n=1 Tax=Remersonia thermophila TaxID=72144 RepID=A0ABR4D9W8_9PEZI
MTTAVCPLVPPTTAASIKTGSETVSEAVRPDISWIPSSQVFKDRAEKLRALYPNRRTTLPEGWPAQVEGARVWSGSDFASEDEYIVRLSPEDIAEIDAGLAFFKGLPGDLGPDDVNPDTFPLPTLKQKLTEVSETIHDGRGFVVLRGLQPEKYSNLDNILLYLGVTSYIAGTRGMQDFDGRMILHIQAVLEDVKKDGKQPNSPYVNRAQPFHADLCDVLAMYALNTAAVGGESYLASGAKIYNELARTRPDIIETLAKDDWIFDEFYQGQYHTRPLLYRFGRHGPGFQFSRRPLTGAPFSPHHPSVPAMTEPQAEALDAVHFLAEEHALELRLRRGDVLLVNNLAALHARAAFADDPARGRRRHLLRLWLRSEDRRWPTPPALERLAWEVYGDHAWRRERAVWDVERSPPELRVKHRRASCA